MSDVSDIETVTAAKKLFTYNLNLDNLKEYLDEMRVQIEAHEEQLDAHEAEIGRRTTEKAITKYLERIAMGVHKDCGERPHTFKLDEPGFLDSDFGGEDGLAMKSSVELMI